MSTVVGRDTTGTGERSPTTLVPVISGQQGGYTVGRAELVATGSEANEALARAEQAGAEYLVGFGPDDGSGTDQGFAESGVLGDMARSAVAALIDDEGLSKPFGLALQAGSPGLSAGPERTELAPCLVAGVAALLQIGGFDPDEPGLGWADVADRLNRGGFAMVGIEGGTFRLGSTPGWVVDEWDHLHQEGRRLRGAVAGSTDPGGRLRLERHRRQVLRAVAAARTDGASSVVELDGRLDRIEAAARRRWVGLRPDEVQQGVGRRADWRHLIDHRSSRSGRSGRDLTMLGLGPAEDWQWLIDDGWARSVRTDLPGPGEGGFDVAVIGPAALRANPDVVARAEAVVTGGASMVRQSSVIVLIDRVRRPRRGAGHRSVVEMLQRSGAVDVRRFLALPDVEAAKRYIPLDHPGGPSWLAGPIPALPQARFPRSRAALRELIRRVAPVAPELLGGVVVVATAGRPSTRGRDDDRETAVVITSGFDEGSRTVVLPFGPDGRPRHVVKITARPAYQGNAEREHRLLSDLQPRVDRPGLIPTPLGRTDDGGRHAVTESYAGRWTVSDVLNEQRSLEAQIGLLGPCLEAITELARIPAPGEPELGSEIWGQDAFDALIGRWFDRLDEIEGPSAMRAALRRSLIERSRAMDGQALPMGVRHFDLGPWNMVLADAADGRGIEAGRSAITVVDWELAPPREIAAGPVGADHLYFTKYWLHIANRCRSIEDEQSAFAFLAADASETTSGVGAAKAALKGSAANLGLSVGLLPLLEAHVWAEAACFTSQRRRDRGGDGGSPARYLDTLARRRVALLEAWSI